MRVLILIMIFGILLVSCTNAPEITNFEECIAAGNPAMESYPRQCRDPISDRTFTEIIEELPTCEELGTCPEENSAEEVIVEPSKIPICVPATCCHPTECVLEADAPDCSEILCSQECAEGTMDCGQGRCVFDPGVEGSCRIEWT